LKRAKARRRAAVGKRKCAYHTSAIRCQRYSAKAQSARFLCWISAVQIEPFFLDNDRSPASGNKAASNAISSA
jgi:hypothetical protein